jgi:glutamate-1-semialdehyde 2,1-aminomutase
MSAKLLEVISHEYGEKTQKSKSLYEEAKGLFPGGVQHNIRFFPPYPFYVDRAKGQYIQDIDGNRYVDFWMGHMGLILGHSPRPVVEALRKQVGNGTHFGVVNKQQVELGKKVKGLVPCADLVRFCCSGTEATMYVTRLARGFTRRRVVIKIRGGWHGGNPALHQAVTSPYDKPDSLGILDGETAYTKTIELNDFEGARNTIREYSSDLAMVLVEPVMGSGCIPSELDFLKGLREETQRVDALLVFDEVITGFRLALGGAQQSYGVKPDLCTLGKILGGGLPIGAICGRKDIMSVTDPTRKVPKNEKVWIGGGTFSGTPLTMIAGLATLDTLSESKEEIYPRISGLAEKARKEIDAIFEKKGIPSLTTRKASLFVTHFLRKPELTVRNSSEKIRNTDIELQFLYYMSMIASHNIFFLPEHTGAVSAAHTTANIEKMLRATEQFAKRLKANR